MDNTETVNIGQVPHKVDGCQNEESVNMWPRLTNKKNSARFSKKL